MKLKSILALLITLITVASVRANEDSANPYPPEIRCVEEPQQADASWTYSGTILMAGYAGIHAMQADWETPRIEAFLSRGTLGEPHEGGQLSPNGQWYAVPVGETWVEVSFNQYWVTYGLRIYSTSDEREITIGYSDYDHLLDYPRPVAAWTHEVVRWIDDETLISGSFLIRPFGEELEVEVAPIPIYSSSGVDFEVSPDGSRIYGYMRSPEEPGHGIFNPEAPEDAIAYFYTQGLAWSHDSLSFVAEQSLDGIQSLALFDRDGLFIESLFVAEEGRIDIRHLASGRNELAWSTDNSKFAFVHYLPYQPAELIILDLENKLAVNTCLNPVSQAVWSPDGRQLAFLMAARENLKLVILDIESWTAYDVARHSGIGDALWPNMVGWRSN